MEFNKQLLDEVYKMYTTENFGYNSYCQECRQHSIDCDKTLINGPVPIFHIGKNFTVGKIRLLIIGMVAYNWSDIISDAKKTWGDIYKGDSNLADQLQNKIENRIYDLYAEEPEEKYCRYLNYALTEIFDSIEEGLDNIALSNFVHCNNNTAGITKDNLPQAVRNYCANINYNKFIFREIEILKPTHVLGLSSNEKYTRFFENIKDLNFKYKFIEHPSSPGRSYDGFTSDIQLFLEE